MLQAQATAKGARVYGCGCVTCGGSLTLVVVVEQHYLVIKDALVRECYRLGYLTKKTAKEMVKIGTFGP